MSRASQGLTCFERMTGLLQGQVTTTLWCREVARERMCTMPKPYPKEFRQNVVEVARAREAGTTLKEIAKDFGILRVVSDELDRDR